MTPPRGLRLGTAISILRNPSSPTARAGLPDFAAHAKLAGMLNYLPSTQVLLESLNFEWPEPRSEQETLDSTPVSAALVDWENCLGAALPETDFDRGRWPATPELLDALRAALVDRCGDVVGHHIAYCLVRCGCRQAATLAGLCEWDQSCLALTLAPDSIDSPIP